MRNAAENTTTQELAPNQTEITDFSDTAQVINASVEWAEPGLNGANDSGSHPPVLCSPLQPSLVEQHKRSSQQHPHAGNNVTAQRNEADVSGR